MNAMKPNLKLALLEMYCLLQYTRSRECLYIALRCFHLAFATNCRLIVDLISFLMPHISGISKEYYRI